MNFQTKSKLIYEELKKDIISGKYKPNERIIISDIAKEFGASNIPVREGFKLLESEGFIKFTPYVGAIVTGLDLEDIKKNFQIRTLLEGLATRMAAERLEKEDWEKLTGIIKRSERSIQMERYDELASLNRQFHDIIYSSCGNEYLKKIIFDLWDFSLRTRGVFTIVTAWARKSVQEHKKVLNALMKRDGATAEKLIITHMENSLSTIREYLKRSTL